MKGRIENELIVREENIYIYRIQVRQDQLTSVVRRLAINMTRVFERNCFGDVSAERPVASRKHHENILDCSNNGTTIPLHILLLRLLRLHSRRASLEARVSAFSNRRRGRKNLRPAEPPCKLLPLPSRSPPLLRRLPANTVPTMRHRRDSKLVLPELPLRSPKQHDQERG